MYYYILYFDIIVSQQEELFWVSFERARTRFFLFCKPVDLVIVLIRFNYFHFYRFRFFFVTPFTLV